MSLFLVGCGNNSEEQRIAELEVEVERLQNEQNLMTLQPLAMQQMMPTIKIKLFRIKRLTIIQRYKILATVPMN